MSSSAKPKNRAKKPAVPTHHIQFVLANGSGAPLTESRAYEIRWTDSGSHSESLRAGVTSADGLTEIVETVGKVPVTLSLAPSDSEACKLVGTAATKPRIAPPRVRVTLDNAAGSGPLAPTAAQVCHTLTVRQGRQTIQYVIKNVSHFVAANNKRYPNRLQKLPYLIIDLKTLAVLSNHDPKDTTPKLMRGSATQVSTDVFAVDDVANVGIVLGSSTDSPEYWKDLAQSENASQLLYRCSPKPVGLTRVVITERQRTGEIKEATVSETEHRGELNGALWAAISRSYSLADVDHFCPVDLEIHTAQGSRHIPWRDILAPIYLGHIEEPSNPLVEKKADKGSTPGKTKPGSHKPEKVPQYTTERFLELIAQGGGKIRISHTGLIIHLSGVGVGGEPFSENAYAVTRINKRATLTRTHPYAYRALIEVCYRLGITTVRLGSTWRPMIGSVLHKLGDALDITLIDNPDDRTPAFTFNNRDVDDLADRFTRALDAHPCALRDGTIYNRDNLEANAPYHEDHLHFTVDRRRPVKQTV